MAQRRCDEETSCTSAMCGSNREPTVPILLASYRAPMMQLPPMADLSKLWGRAGRGQGTAASRESA